MKTHKILIFFLLFSIFSLQVSALTIDKYVTDSLKQKQIALIEPGQYGSEGVTKVHIKDDKNVSKSYYMLNNDDFMISTPTHTVCEWYDPNKDRKCYQELQITYKKTDGKKLTTSDISGLFKEQKFKNFEVVNHNTAYKKNFDVSLTKDQVYNFTITFDYPANSKEEWNISLFKNDIIIDPEISACSEITSAGTYTLTSDITDATTANCIDIKSSNVTVDCAGHTIDALYSAFKGTGIRIGNFNNQDIDNILIKNCTLTDWYFTTMDLNYGNNFTLQDSSLQSSGLVRHSLSISVYDNIILNNSEFYGGSSTNSAALDGSSISNLTIENSYLIGENSIDVFNFVGSMTIINSNLSSTVDIPIEYSSSSSCDITLDNASSVTANDIIVFQNSNINIQNWDNNFTEIIVCNATGTINNITLNNSIGGLNLVQVNNLTVTNLNIIDSGTAIYYSQSTNSTFENNTILQASTNVFNMGASSGLVFNNNIIGDSEFFIGGGGLYYTNISNNYFYGTSAIFELNSIANNLLNIWNNHFNLSSCSNYISDSSETEEINVSKQLGTRKYSSGPYIGGNYWGCTSNLGYSDTCTDSDYDGFCDTAYTENGLTDSLAYSDEYDDVAPTYSDLSNNGTSAYYGLDVKFSINISDTKSLNEYVFSENQTGSWVNYSAVSMTSNPYIANNTIEINVSKNTYLCGKFYFTDNASNENSSTNSCFTTTNAPPIATIVINGTPLETTDVVLVNLSVFDGDSDTITINETRWYNGSTEVTAFQNLTQINGTDINNGETWSIAFRAYDGTTFGDWDNVSTQIGDATAPEITGYAIEKSSWTSAEIVTFYANCTDPSIITNVIFTVSGTNKSMYSIADSQYKYNNETFGLGSYNITHLYCIDEANNVATAYPNVTFTVTETVVEGGGGGGGSKPICNIILNEENITMIGTRTFTLQLFNNETESYVPSIVFSELVNPYVTFTIPTTEIPSGTQGEINIININTTTNVSGEVRLTSVNCADIVLPITIEPRRTGADFFNKELFKIGEFRVTNFIILFASLFIGFLVSRLFEKSGLGLQFLVASLAIIAIMTIFNFVF